MRCGAKIRRIQKEPDLHLREWWDAAVGGREGCARPMKGMTLRCRSLRFWIWWMRVEGAVEVEAEVEVQTGIGYGRLLSPSFSPWLAAPAPAPAAYQAIKARNRSFYL